MLSNACRHSALGLANGGGFTPLRLFASGAQGAWYDPSDFSTLFQDSAGTTPVTATGQPVGKVLDKSGRSNHATQATAASRPLLQQDASGFYYLNFDGVDDSLATGSIDFSALSQMTVWAGVNKQSDAATGVLLGLGASDAGLAGGIQVSAPSGPAAPSYGALLHGATALGGSTIAGHPAPDSSVLSVLFDQTAATTLTQAALRCNTVAATTSTGSVGGGGTFANAPLFIGRRGGSSLPFNGRSYGLIVLGAAASAATIAQTERFIGNKMGISL